MIRATKAVTDSHVRRTQQPQHLRFIRNNFGGTEVVAVERSEVIAVVGSYNMAVTAFVTLTQHLRRRPEEVAAPHTREDVVSEGADTVRPRL